MSRKEFEQLLPLLEDIPEKEVIRPHIPVAVELQEAENLYWWCQNDKEPLVASGLDWSVVESLPERTDACRYAESVWKQYYHSRKERNSLLRKKIREGFALRTRLLQFFDFAFRNDSGWKGKSRAIKNSRKNVAMIQHLIDLSVIGKANAKILEAISFDMSLLDAAVRKSEELAYMYAQHNDEVAKQNRLMDLRNRSYTYLKQAMITIREHGRFAFRDCPGRRKGYISHYRKLH
ncbi:hypothetical protein [Thermophagus xiamenensis]|uniref:Uncharacterized protein n=1 Tax=Thermophagus xiamenensis TaxID=385682 RepID=A0A1I2BT88_9BACT|nr:hypothetical protein [Thermophagus xiamenensis]SFE59237.1 hypothetical protein SAMN05444380_11431 [Thermophagus xiamenensis]